MFKAEVTTKVKYLNFKAKPKDMLAGLEAKAPALSPRLVSNTNFQKYYKQENAILPSTSIQNREKDVQVWY